ncbi:MAG: PIN domain-containing protein [Opitutales bacterium]
MKRFIADTSVWSIFLRRSSPDESELKAQLRAAILSDEVQMLGIIRQECLSGIKEHAQFIRLKEYLDGFPDLLATTEDHLKAAEYCNTCRRKGFQGGFADFLICAQANSAGLPILTKDKDFLEYQRILPIRLVGQGA